MKKQSTELLLEMDLAFKAAGIEFLNSEKALVLDYLYKTNAEDKENSILKKMKRVSLEINKHQQG
jgi:hypothetical protein